MKLTVEMNVTDFEEFRRWQEGKSESERRYNELLRKAYKLRDKLMDAILIDKKKKTAEIMDYNDIMQAIDLAYEL